MRLKRLRKEIDNLDKKIVSLLNNRASLVKKIGRLKRDTGKPIYMPDRESEIYMNIRKFNKGPLSDKALVSIYREIMSTSLSLEKGLQIAYLGPEATFTHLAAMKKFGSNVSYCSCSSITDVFKEVEKERCDYGVVPIENSTEGMVNHTLDMFINSDLKICSEILLEVSHNLLSTSKSLKEIKKIYSKTEVFGQCRIWLDANMHNTELVEVSTTGRAAEIASREKGSAAIASDLAAEKYNLNILAKGIEDSPNNITRFLVIGEEMPTPTDNDKTSIMFGIKDKVGALHDILTPFKKYGINLTKIESRPSRRRAWEYYFFVDMLGHCEDRPVRKALKELERHCIFLKILGSYPAGVMT